MKTISTVEQLDKHLKSINAEITTHICIDWENELPTYSVEQLYNEGRALYGYIQSNDNYVAAYHGCGLLSRCLSKARSSGAIFSYKLFKSLGHSNRISREMKDFYWY